MAHLQIEYLPVEALKPYRKNARVHDEADVEALKASIEDYDFSDPIGIWGPENLIVEGHGRLMAAKQLGLAEVPCIRLDHLDAEQQKAYRLAHNRTAELSFWDNKKVKLELGTLKDLSTVAKFNFFKPTTATEQQARQEEPEAKKAWGHVKKFCGLKLDTRTAQKGDAEYTTFFRTSTDEDGEAMSIDEIKNSPEMAQQFAQILSDHVLKTFGPCVSSHGSWGIVTTPRRRHTEGFHFATEVCTIAAVQLAIPFFPDVAKPHSRDRLNTQYSLLYNPDRPNLILFDDIITTGTTFDTTRKLLIDAGHVVFGVVAIKNY